MSIDFQMIYDNIFGLNKLMLFSFEYEVTYSGGRFY